MRLSFFQKAANLYAKIFASISVFFIRLFNLPFLTTGRKHTVQFDVVEACSKTYFLDQYWDTSTALLYDRTIRRFYIESDLVSFIKSRATAGKVFWDVGACIGNFSILAAKNGAKVVAFEPDGMTFGVLEKNVKNSKLTIKALPIALGDKNHIAELFMRDGEIASAYNTVDRNVDHRAKTFSHAFVQSVIELQAKHLIEFFQVEKPNILKIDVDGNEYLVLQGFGELLRDPGLEAVVIELFEENEEHRKCISLLEQFGFVRKPELSSKETLNIFFLRA